MITARIAVDIYADVMSDHAAELLRQALDDLDVYKDAVRKMVDGTKMSGKGGQSPWDFLPGL